MKIEGWRYYNYGAIPTTAPHAEVNLAPVEDGSIWKIDGGVPLLVRWESHWDYPQETNWWHVIKDIPYDISALKSKRRYEITKGLRNFRVDIINLRMYEDEIYFVLEEAFKGWPEKYRPTVNKEFVSQSIDAWEEGVAFGAFDDEEKLRGIAVVNDYDSFASFSILRTDPKAEKRGINAAIVYTILEFFRNRFGDGFYIDDGARAILHETGFQNYLEKYFGFRKAYCSINIKYRFGLNLIIKMIFPFRKVIPSSGRLGSRTSAVLRMEEIRRRLDD